MKDEGMSLDELTKKIGISKTKINTYRSNAIPLDYRFDRKKDLTYDYSEKDAKLFKRIERMNKEYTLRQIRRIVTLERRKEAKEKAKYKWEDIIIPEFMADCIDKEKEKGTDIFHFIEKRLYRFHQKMEDYLDPVGERKRKARRNFFLKVWVDGYDGVEEYKYFEIGENKNKYTIVKLDEVSKEEEVNGQVYKTFPFKEVKDLKGEEIDNFGRRNWLKVVHGER